jgi:hypothetical protein
VVFALSIPLINYPFSYFRTGPNDGARRSEQSRVWQKEFGNRVRVIFIPGRD